MTDAPDGHSLTDEERALLESLVATSLPAGKARWGAILAKYDRLLSERDGYKDDFVRYCQLWNDVKAERDEWKAKAERAKPELAKQTLIEASREIYKVLLESGEWQRRTVEAVRALATAKDYIHSEYCGSQCISFCDEITVLLDEPWAQAILKEETA